MSFRFGFTAHISCTQLFNRKHSRYKEIYIYFSYMRSGMAIFFLSEFRQWKPKHREKHNKFYGISLPFAHKSYQNNSVRVKANRRWLFGNVYASLHKCARSVKACPPGHTRCSTGNIDSATVRQHKTIQPIHLGENTKAETILFNKSIHHWLLV